jgi:hypothetical protein
MRNWRMRRWSTALIVVGVAALAVLAAADALRGNDEPTAPVASPTITRPRPQTLRELLRREEIAGFVVYSDQDCLLHSLLLPQLEDDVVREEGGAGVLYCRFGMTGGRMLEEGEVMSPDRSSIARCRAGRVVVRDAQSDLERQDVAGCPPAWRPDGALTYPRGNAILQDGRPLFTARELRRAARLHPNVAGVGAGIPIFAHATDLAWLDEDHLVATLEIRVQGVEPLNLAVLFDGKAVVAVATNRGQGLGNWVVSSQGAYAASEDGTIVSRDGGSTDPPANLPDGTAVAFSPDERWLAYVTAASVYLIGTPRNSEPARIIRLPVRAQDLVWEGVSRATRVAGLGTG